MQMSRQ